MRNFEIQATFFCNYSHQIIFSQENVIANNFLALLLAEFVALLLPLTIPDFSRTVFTQLSTWLFCCLEFSPLPSISIRSVAKPPHKLNFFL